MLRVQGVLQGNRLGIGHIDGLSLGEAFIVFAVHLSGALLSAGAAGNAFLDVHVPRVTVKIDFEISLFTADVHDFREREDLDIQMPADLDQFWRDNSHCTVIGRKCLVKLRHDTSYSGCLFN